MATAAVSLLHLTRIPRTFSILPFLRPPRSSSLTFKRTCKPPLCFGFFRSNSPRYYSVVSSSSSDWNNHVAAGEETYDVIVVGGVMLAVKLLLHLLV
ncbi:hypothetical protein HanHA300_Chr03g0113731 [Helianthus annuus]|nr:hypothetical protein HanHA300_Chr03g0113731 [Helianthus annuus]